MTNIKLAPVLAGMLILAGAAAADEGRWYGPDQVAAGASIYARSCAGCHGAAGEAAPGWEKPDGDGYLPAPPLNGTAHTWHHPLDVLRRTVTAGGAAVGGSMPAFEGVLDDGDVDAVIAYVQSLWPDELYQAWARNDAGAAAAADSPGGSTAPAAAVMTQRLSKLLPPDAPVSEPLPTPMEGIYEVSASGRILYLDDEGRYALVGDIIDLETGASITEARRSADRASRMSAFPQQDKIVFAASGQEKAHIDVFTDTTCPYCRKLHNEIPALQAAGISVRYVAFPRGGNNSKGDRELRAVWCDGDPVQSMHQAKTRQVIPENDGTCEAGKAVAAGYRLGLDLGVRGTPAIVLPDGRMISGYRPHDKIVSALGLESD